MQRRRPAVAPELLLGLAAFAGLLPLLVYGPQHFGVPSDVVSAAAAEGYSGRGAYLLAAGWLGVTVVAAAWQRRRESREAYASGAAAAAVEPAGGGGAGAWWVAGVAGLVMVVAYFPPFLAATGPFIEDQIHLTALHRMLGGQRPYVDFEFLYGPLMLYLAAGWTYVFGYSLLSFYWYVAMLEAIQLAIMVAVIWWLIPERRWRVVALLVVGGLILNALVGPNWSATRRLAGFLGLLVVASGPLATRHVLTAAALFGIQLAYSHDFGVASLAGAGAMYAVLLAATPRWRVAGAGAFVAAGAGLVWFVTTRLLLGGDFGSYLSETADLMARFSAGEAGFRFYWTVNSLAVFAVLVLAAVVVGRRLATLREGSPNRADLLLVGGFVFALVGLKSGLNRSDLWHLDASLVPLALALLMPYRRHVPGRRRVRILSGALLVVVSLTYVFGLLPSGSLLASGWVRGAAAVIAPAEGSPAAALPPTRAPVLDRERLAAGSPTHQLAVFLHRPEWVDRPVIFYGDTWSLGKAIGVYRTSPINDDFLYSDERGLRFRAHLEENADALVLMRDDVYRRLYGLSDPNEFPEHERRFAPSPAKRIASWLSTTHYRGLEHEVRLKDRRWTRTVGEYVRPRYEAIAQIGRIVILAPSATT